MRSVSVLRLVRSANPISPEDLGGSAATAEAENLLRQITSSSGSQTVPASAARPSRRRLVAVAAAVVIVTGVPIALQSGDGPPAGPGSPATPRMLNYRPSGEPADELLRQLASRAEGQQAGVGAGPYRYSKVQRWRLAFTGEPQAPELVETWVAPDGTGRTVGQQGQNVPAGSGQPRSLPNNATIELSPVRPSGIVADPPVDLSPMSVDPRVLSGQLDALPPRVKEVTGRSPDWFRRYVQIRAIWSEQPVPSTLQAAFLRVLADTPGLSDRGEVTDRTGRRGRAVSVDLAEGAATVRHVFLLDPVTGMPTGYEEIVLGPVPTVTQYAFYLAVARVATDHTTP